jgi:phage shock protein PspC (stress-responsive transcriptional regulator)
MNQKKLTRSILDRKIAGVCGGIGEYLDVDPLIFRIIFLFLLLCGGGGFILYVIMWILMPEKKKIETLKTEYDEVQQNNETDKVEEIIDSIDHSLNNSFMKKNKGIFWGLLLVAIGLLWLGKTFALFHFSWWNLWRLYPIIFIWLGITLLPIERVWKNVCSFILLAIAIMLIFVLPTKPCRFHWKDKCYIKNKIESFCNDHDNDWDWNDTADFETISVKVDSGMVIINKETLEDGEKKIKVKKIEL